MDAVCYILTLNACNVNCRRNINIYICFIWIRFKQIWNTRLTLFRLVPGFALSRTVPIRCFTYNITLNEDTRLSTCYIISNWYSIIAGRFNITLYGYCVGTLWWRFLYNISRYGNSTLLWLHITHDTYGKTTSSPGFYYNTTLWNLNTIITITYITLFNIQSILCWYSWYLITRIVIFILYQNCRRSNIIYGSIY